MSKLGDLDLDKVYCMNCLDGLKKIPDESVDLVLTDPPYNIGDDSKRTKVGDHIVSNNQAWGKWDNYDEFDYDLLIMQIISEAYRVLKRGGAMYLFSARKDNGFFIRQAERKGFIYRNQLAIIKENPLPHFNKNNWRSAFELCMYVSKDKPKTFNFLSQQELINIFPYLIGRKETEHPTEKPLDFFKKLVQVSSNENDIVLDPFMGSGTTAVACKQVNRHFIGFELDEEYHKMIEKRLEQTYQRIGKQEVLTI